MAHKRDLMLALYFGVTGAILFGFAALATWVSGGF